MCRSRLRRLGFDADRAAVLARAAAAGVYELVIPGYSPATWSRAAALTSATNAGVRVHVAVGLHPYALAGPALPEGELTGQLVAAAECFGAVAIGECGLDGPLSKRTAGGVSSAVQERVLREHVHAAALTGLPLVLHVVRAHAAALELLRPDTTRRETPGPRGVVHAFSGSVDVARSYVRLGFMLAFGGAITHARHQRARAAAAWVPDDALLLESDAPSGRLSGGPPRNEPSALPRVLAVLAELRGQSQERVAEMTRDNAARLFRVGPLA